ncbi:MAG: hypothetical protein J6D03_00645 [Clostridia bacterium]|nr:hypothetical protein [Clostridia bacterium]
MANIDIKKLFVKVDLSNPGVSTKWAASISDGTLDNSKIYFLSNGTLYVPVTGKYYGVSDTNWDKINQDIANEIDRATKAEDAINAKIDIINGDDATTGSIAKAVKDAVDKIMGGEGIDEALDTIKEIAEWIKDPNNEDGIQGFLQHVAEFEKHVEDANKRMDDIEASIEENKAASDESLSKFINGGEKDVDGNYVTTFPEGISVGYDLDEVGKINVANFKEYIDAQADYDKDQVAWLQKNSAAIETEKNRAIETETAIQEELTEHKSHNHAFFNEKPSTDSRNILWLNQNDAIFGYGGETALEDPSKDSIGNMTGKSGMIIELSKYNVVDIADSKFHTNINVASADNEATIDDVVVSSNDDGIHTVKTGKTVPGVKINDIYTVATRNELVALNKSINDKLDTKSDALEARVADNESILAGLGVHVAEGETAEYDTVVEAIDGQIAKLDLEATKEDAIAKDGKEYITTTISQTDGIVKNESVDVKYGIFDDSTGKGIATVEDTKSWTISHVANEISKLDASVKSAENGITHVIVTIGQTDGIVSNVAVETKDIASNHELLEHKAEFMNHKVEVKEKDFANTSSIGTALEQQPGETYETAKTQEFKLTEDNKIVENGTPVSTNKLSVWGGIAKLKNDTANDLANTIASLAKDATPTSEDGEGKVTVTMSEAAGIVSIDKVDVTYAKLTDTELSEGIVDSTTLKSAIDTSFSNLWEEFVAE